MLYGCKFLNEKDNADFWDKQTDNLIEEVFRKLIAQIKSKFTNVKYSNLETCGNTAAENCLRAIGRNVVIKCPGGYQIPTVNALSEFHNNPLNKDKFKGMGFDPLKTPANRVFASYPVAIKEVTGNICVLEKYKEFDDVCLYLKEGKSIQMCFKKPGHFFSVIGFDDESKELICIDPWPGRTGNYLFKLTKSEFENNTFATILIYKE